MGPGAGAAAVVADIGLAGALDAAHYDARETARVARELAAVAVRTVDTEAFELDTHVHLNYAAAASSVGQRILLALAHVLVVTLLQLSRRRRRRDLRRRCRGVVLADVYVAFKRFDIHRLLCRRRGRAGRFLRVALRHVRRILLALAHVLP